MPLPPRAPELNGQENIWQFMRQTVKLSSFGLFVVRQKAQRLGRNPRTGEEVPISPRRVVVFKPSAVLKQRINAPRSPVR